MFFRDPCVKFGIVLHIMLSRFHRNEFFRQALRRIFGAVIAGSQSENQKEAQCDTGYFAEMLWISNKISHFSPPHFLVNKNTICAKVSIKMLVVLFILSLCGFICQIKKIRMVLNLYIPWCPSCTNPFNGTFFHHCSEYGFQRCRADIGRNFAYFRPLSAYNYPQYMQIIQRYNYAVYSLLWERNDEWRR